MEEVILDKSLKITKVKTWSEHLELTSAVYHRI